MAVTKMNRRQLLQSRIRLADAWATAHERSWYRFALHQSAAESGEHCSHVSTYLFLHYTDAFSSFRKAQEELDQLVLQFR